MALNDTQGATDSTDVVAVLDKDLRQVFPDARPIKLTVREEAKLMEHPVETGATVVDHRIIVPKEIELSCMLTSVEYADVYQQIKAIYLRGDSMSVQTRVDNYESMVIESIPHEETSEIMDGIPLIIRLKEVKYVSAEFTERKIPVSTTAKNSKTVNRGEQRPTETAPEKKGSLLSKMGLLK